MKISHRYWLFLCLGFFSSGCGGSGQSDICKQYIECEAYAAEQLQRAEMKTFLYGPNAVCWETDELAASCNDVCLSSIDDLQETLTNQNLELGPCE